MLTDVSCPLAPFYILHCIFILSTFPSLCVGERHQLAFILKYLYMYQFTNLPGPFFLQAVYLFFGLCFNLPQCYLSEVNSCFVCLYTMHMYIWLSHCWYLQYLS
jgi:hypothetical protein